MSISLFALMFVACGETPAPAAPKVEEPTCPLTVDTLDGTSWVYLKPQPVGPDKPSPRARAKFVGNGPNFVAKYTADSLGDTYEYNCTSDGKLATCVESKESHPVAFCKAWAASHDGVCDPAGVAAATGLPLADLEKVAEGVNKELAALKPDEKATQRQVDNSPKNKIRGKIVVAVDKAKCRLKIQDKYQTMIDGRLNEFENQIGLGTFDKAKEDYIFETCKDVENAWAPSAADDTKHEAVQAAGAIKFAAIPYADKKQVKANCTYTADIYKDWVKAASDVPSVESKDYGVRWDTAIPFTDPGHHAVFFDRYMTCDGGAKERIGLACAVVRIEQ